MAPTASDLSTVFKQAEAEHQALPGQRFQMPDEDILQHARTMPTEHLICRQGRHRYPYVAPRDKVYRLDKTSGYDLFCVDCEICGEAYREERWTIKENRKGLVTQMTFWGAKTKYHKADDGGRSAYLLPKGAGFIPGSLLLEAHTVMEMAGGMVRRAA